ncbi:MAG: alkaline phosphatase [Kofleriaceae bacterium]|nr:alkaline phosphatase [Kofleriaceae bacterium]
MGAAHFSLAKLLRRDRFQVGRLTEVGLVSTHSTSSLVTDSAAAATAYATGIKTANGFVGIGPDRRHHPTVLEVAERRGRATGLVTTAAFGDASPAAFAAHHDDRKDRRALARQIAQSGADLLISTGLESFGDDLPPLETVAAIGGFQAVRTIDQLRAAGDAPVLAALRSGEDDGDSPDASLPMLAGWALEHLARDPDGFFLFVEQEGTDTASHHNACGHLQAAASSFDETVGVVLDFAEKRGDVLVVVAGDHETGGLQLTGTPDQIECRWATDGHTGGAVPLFARGPGASRFATYLDNAEVGKALLDLLE